MSASEPRLGPPLTYWPEVVRLRRVLRWRPVVRLDGIVADIVRNMDESEAQPASVVNAVVRELGLVPATRREP